MTEELNSEPQNQFSNKDFNQHKPTNKAKERARMDFKVRDYKGASHIIAHWGNEKLGVKSPRFWEYLELWKWLKVRATKEDKDLDAMGSTPGGIRMSVEYIRRVHEDQMDKHTPKTLRDVCHTFLDDYLLWFESDLAEFVFRCEQLVETQRIKSQYHVARKKLIAGVETGDKKMLEMYLKATGRAVSEAEEKEGYRTEVVDKYLDTGKVANKKVVNIFKGPPKVDNSNRADHGHENRGKDSIPKELNLAERIAHVEGQGS